MTISEQLRLLPEGRDQSWPPLHRAQMPARTVPQVAKIAGAVIRHRVPLEVAPDVLDGIELGRVGRQVLKEDATVLGLQIVFDHSRAVRLQSVPHDQQLLADRRLQRLQELDDLRALDRTFEEAKVEAPKTHPCHDRKLLPGEAVLQDGGLSLRSPSTCAAGSLRQTRLVDEDDYSPLPRGDFFSAGHLFCFQLRIAASSRSRARPVGRCTLQPSSCRILQTEDCASFTPKRSSISIPTRGSVHSSLVKPAARAPAFNNLMSCARCSSLSLGGRPKRSARFKPEDPPCSCSFLQRNTDWRDTPTRRATSAGHTPAARRRIPRFLRRSSSCNCCSISIATSNVTIRGTSTASVAKSVIHLSKSQ